MTDWKRFKLAPTLCASQIALHMSHDTQLIPIQAAMLTLQYLNQIKKYIYINSQYKDEESCIVLKLSKIIFP